MPGRMDTGLMCCPQEPIVASPEWRGGGISVLKEDTSSSAQRVKLSNEATLGELSELVAAATADKVANMLVQINAQLAAMQRNNSKMESMYETLAQQMNGGLQSPDVAVELGSEGAHSQRGSMEGEEGDDREAKRTRPQQTVIGSMLESLNGDKPPGLEAEENRNHVGSTLIGDEDGGDEFKKKKRKLKKALTALVPEQVHSLAKAWRKTMAQRFMARVVNSSAFDGFYAFMIVLNAFLIGAEVQYRTEHEDNHVIFVMSQYIFCILFAVEFIFRFGADFVHYFAKRGWGYFDLVMVIVSAMEVIDAITVAGDQSSRLQVFLKATRMVRLLRIVRVFKFSSHLQIMVFMIVESFKSLFSTVLLLLIILYIFALCFTIGATDYLDDADFLTDKQQGAKKYFGSVYDSALTCFQSMTSGLSWTEAIDPLRGMGDIYVIVFLFFIVFSLFVLVNIITGVFVDHALAKSQTERDLVVEKELQMKKACVNNLKELFSESDEDKSGTVDYNEFIKHLKNPRVLAYMSALKLDTSNLVELFNKLDADGNGSIEIHEFVERCMYMMRAQSSEQFLMRLQEEIVELKSNMIRGLYDLQEQTNRVNEEFRDLLQSNRFAGSPSQRFMGSPSGSLLALRTNPPSMRSIEA